MSSPDGNKGPNSAPQVNHDLHVETNQAPGSNAETTKPSGRPNGNFQADGSARKRARGVETAPHAAPQRPGRPSSTKASAAQHEINAPSLTALNAKEAADPATKRAKLESELKSSALSPLARPSSHLNFSVPAPTKSPAAAAPGQIAPGEALRQWIEENETVEQEEALIEELPEAAPAPQITAEDLALDVAAGQFKFLLQRLVPSRDAISQATAAALKLAEAGAGPRAVRIALDAAAEAAGPKERLPYLYLLDSAIKSEWRKSQQIKEEGKVVYGFGRAVGAALMRLVELLVGSSEVLEKVEKTLNVWQREGMMSEGLLRPAFEAVKEATKEAQIVQAQVQRQVEKEKLEKDRKELEAMMQRSRMGTKMKLTYTMPNGEVRVIQQHSPDPAYNGWSTPADLGISPPMKKASSRVPLFLQPRRTDSPAPFIKIPGVDYSKISPWRQQWIGLEMETGSAAGATQGGAEQPVPPPQAPYGEPGGGAGEELDEFDQGLFRDLVGGAGAMGNAAPGAGGYSNNYQPPPPAPLPPQPASIDSLEDGELPQNTQNPMQMPGFYPSQDGNMMNMWQGGDGCGSGFPPSLQSNMEQDGQQWQMYPQQQQQQVMMEWQQGMMMQQQMAMAANMGMGMPMAMQMPGAMMGAGMGGMGPQMAGQMGPMPINAMHVAMGMQGMNPAAMMGGYNPGGAGMLQQQQKQQQGKHQKQQQRRESAGRSGGGGGGQHHQSGRDNRDGGKGNRDNRGRDRRDDRDRRDHRDRDRSRERDRQCDHRDRDRDREYRRDGDRDRRR